MGNTQNFCCSHQTPANASFIKPHSKLQKGLNLRAKCVKKDCQEYQKKIWIHFKQMGQYQIHDLQASNCPCGHKIQKIIEIAILNAKYRTEEHGMTDFKWYEAPKIQNQIFAQGQQGNACPCISIPFSKYFINKVIHVRDYDYKDKIPHGGSFASSSGSNTDFSTSRNSKSLEQEKKRFMCKLSKKLIKVELVHYACKMQGCKDDEETSTQYYEKAILEKEIQQGGLCKNGHIMDKANIKQRAESVYFWKRFTKDWKKYTDKNTVAKKSSVHRSIGQFSSVTH